MVRSLYDLGFFSSRRMKIGKNEIAPRELTAKLFVEKFTSDAPDICIMRVEAHRNGSVASYSLVDYYDPAAQTTAMIRTTSWPASFLVITMPSRARTNHSGT